MVIGLLSDRQKSTVRSSELVRWLLSGMEEAMGWTMTEDRALTEAEDLTEAGEGSGAVAAVVVEGEEDFEEVVIVETFGEDTEGAEGGELCVLVGIEMVLIVCCVGVGRRCGTGEAHDKQRRQAAVFGVGHVLG